MFSPADYELVARLTGLPVARTPAERAAAAPVVAQVLRDFARMRPMSPGVDTTSMQNLGATRSLNRPVETEAPEAKSQLEQRLRAGVTGSAEMARAQALAEMVLQEPELVMMLLDMLVSSRMEGEASGEYFSQQEPVQYDVPNYGGQYSMLNAPSSSPIPASIRYQPLS